MLIINNKAQITLLNSLKKHLLLLTVSLLTFTQAMANESSIEKYSVSQGISTQDLSEQARKMIIAETQRANIPDQLKGKATAKTRVEIFNSDKPLVGTTKKSTLSRSYNNLSQDYSADFAIYGATSFLQDDYDGDGFYQTFSVLFDADIYSYTENQVGEVYALLYISKNGGPWTHYFTTDDFIIEADTDLDEYEVITTFLSGYSSDYYDVLIDLYQVGYSDIVATYSSDDSNALYALPLESADYDEPYIEVIEVSSGGSISMLILFLLYVFSIRIKK